MGVHEWIPHVARLAARARVEIEEISYPMVQNALALSNMFDGADVRSCMAPYFCPSCKEHVTVKVTRDEVEASGTEPPAKRCARCAAPMEFEELDVYFSFFQPRKAT
jgi:hypothetical protein